MSKQFIDINTGKIGTKVSDNTFRTRSGEIYRKISDNLWMKPNGKIVTKLANNVYLDQETGDMHYLSSL